MSIVGPGKRLMIYIGDSDQWQRRPLYLALLETLKREGLAGATVTRGLAGFGAHSRVVTASLLRLSSDLPLIIAVVDTPEQIERVLPLVMSMVGEGLVTVEDVQIVRYKHRGLPELPQDRLVAEVMSADPVRVAPETPADRLVELLLRHEVKAVPVVADDGRVVGIITAGDLLRRAGVELRLGLQGRLTDAELAEGLHALAQSGKCAADIMTPDPATVAPTNTVAEAGRLMVRRDVKRLPVVDAAGQLVGIVSRLDLLRTLQVGSEALAQAQLPARDGVVPAARTAGEIMDRAVPVVRPETPLAEVLDLMVASPHRRVVVVDEDGRLAGLITDGTLLASVEAEARPGILQALRARLHWSGERTVAGGVVRHAADAMLADVATVRADAPLADVLSLMAVAGRKRLPVIDEQGRFLGIVERQALLRALVGDPARP